mgnify:CR=1 FL=1
MIIKNVTEFTDSEMAEMLAERYKKPAAYLTVFSVIFGIASIITLVLDAFELIPGFVPDIFLYLFLFSVIFAVTLRSLKKSYKKMNTNFAGKTVCDYTFYDDYFEVETFLGGQTSLNKIRYDSLYDVSDYGTYFLIYISKVNVHICKFSGFDIDELPIVKEKLLCYSRKSKK